MEMTRTLYPITLFLDVESLDLLIDALAEHANLMTLIRRYSAEETNYVLREALVMQAELKLARTHIHGLASQAVTRQHAVTPGSSVHKTREGGTLL